MLMDEQRREFYQEFAKHLARQIVPSDEIKPFVGRHPKLVGDFAEAQIRRFVRQVVSPLHVSHGAIIAAESYGDRVKEVDTIIWIPNPLPPLVEVDDFALIPWTSSMGVLEIKNSAYRSAGEAIASVLAMEGDLTCGSRPTSTRGIPAALGVVVLEREPITDEKLKRLIADQKVVVLLRQEGNSYHPNTEAILELVNFLASIRRRASQLSNAKVDPRKGYKTVRDDTRTTL
jgi:hypothetical protein